MLLVYVCAIVIIFLLQFLEGCIQFLFLRVPFIHSYLIIKDACGM